MRPQSSTSCQQVPCRSSMGSTKIVIEKRENANSVGGRRCRSGYGRILKMPNGSACSILQGNLRYPAKQPSCFRDIEANPVNFTSAPRYIARLDRFAEEVADAFEYFAVGCRYPAA